MDLQTIECFLALADNLSFTETAKKFGLTQPSVSRQIKLLEERLATQLFYRDKHRVQLTKEGKEFKTKLQPIAKEFKTVLDITTRQSEEMSGTLQFGCLPEIGQSFFLEAILGFQKKYPLIDIHTQYGLEPELIEKMKSGDLDFAVLNRPIISENLRSYRLLEERATMVTRTKNNASPTPVSEARFVGYNDEDTLLSDYFKTHFKSQELSQISRFTTVNSHRSMIDLLLSFDSFAVLPYLSIEEQIKKKKLKSVGNKDIKTSLYLIHPENVFFSKKNIEFKNFIIETCRNKSLT